ncbi:response regulator transcription factor [Alkalibacillus silvisoli]|uniref:Response regulator n=1 Tax=Alkalibacillus silvisoli TaxID=392823 RepID=A0ABN0ZR74_9BACI
MSIKVLIVDDEESITTLIKHHLDQAGFESIVVYDGETAINKLHSEKFDLVVLDLMLPKISGVEVCKQMRNLEDETPVIMLTAKATEDDKITGLNVGADDYLTKPFSPKELVARIYAVLRRFKQTKREDQNSIIIKDIEIFEDRYEVYKNGGPVSFTRKEFELLLYLAKQIGKPVKRELLLKDIWDFEYVGDTRIVDVHISHLREKLEDTPKKPTLIKTVRGVGYKIEG